MKKKILTILAACAGLFASAADGSNIVPSQMSGVWSDNGWKSNWFIGASAGFTTYLGSHVSSDDFFGRTRFLGRAEFGKWHSPAVGTRLAFDLYSYESSDGKFHKYQDYRLDVLWNICSYWSSEGEMSRWIVAPYFGSGLANNSTMHHHRFAIGYGVIGKFRVSDHLSIGAEAGAITSYRDLDADGCCRDFSAHFFNFSLGLTYTLNPGWSRVSDAGPYMRQNKTLRSWCQTLRERQECLERNRDRDANVIYELKKILSIEGLLDKYSDRIEQAQKTSLGQNYEIPEGTRAPRNNYSGINSLRERLRAAGYSESDLKAYGDWTDDSENEALANYIASDIAGNPDMLPPYLDMALQDASLNGTDYSTSSITEDYPLNEDGTPNLDACTPDQWQSLMESLGINPDGCVSATDMARLQEIAEPMPAGSQGCVGDCCVCGDGSNGLCSACAKNCAIGAGLEPGTYQFLNDIAEAKTPIGAPIYFFFSLNSDQIIDAASQDVNIAEIARLAIRYDLTVRVVGAADSMTGSKERNRQLSNERAHKLSSELQKKGVNPNKIVAENVGGIEQFDRNETNRYSHVELYVK